MVSPLRHGACIWAIAMITVPSTPTRGDEAPTPPTPPPPASSPSAPVGDGSGEPIPLMVFHSPAGQSRAADNARSALAMLAQRKGTAFLDLSPKALPAPVAAAELGRGIEAYRGFEYDAALLAFSRGLEEATRTGAAGLSASELSDLYIYRGLTFSQRGDTARAWDDFTAAATLDPTRKLDPVRYPPRVIETFNRATQAVLNGPFGTLVIVADSGCQVSIDGRSAGAGESRALPFGHHYVRVECAGYAPYGGRILAQQAEQRFEPGLQKIAAPSDERARQLGRERSTAAVLFARVVVADNLPPTLVLRWLDVATGEERQRASIALQPSTAASSAARATEMLFAKERAVRAAAARAASPPRTVPSDTVFQQAPSSAPWYRKPWVWGIAGALLATALITPFVLDSSSDTGFEVRPGGDLPPSQ